MLRRQLIRSGLLLPAALGDGPLAVLERCGTPNAACAVAPIKNGSRFMQDLYWQRPCRASE